MHILDAQDIAIKTVFPDYNREKSSIIMEFGNGCDGDFIAKIYRKGVHRFDLSGGEVVYHKRVK